LHVLYKGCGGACAAACWQDRANVGATSALISFVLPPDFLQGLNHFRQHVAPETDFAFRRAPFGVPHAPPPNTELAEREAPELLGVNADLLERILLQDDRLRS